MDECVRIEMISLLFFSLLLLLPTNSQFTASGNGEGSNPSEGSATDTITTNTTGQRSSNRLTLFIIGGILFLLVLIIILFAVLFWLRRKNSYFYLKIASALPFIEKLNSGISNSIDSSRSVNKDEKEQNIKKLEKALKKIQKKPDGNIASYLTTIHQIIVNNSISDYASVFKEKGAVKLLIAVLNRNKRKEVLISTIDCLCIIVETTGGLKKLAKDPDSTALKFIDNFLYHHKEDTEEIAAILNLLKIFVNSKDIPNESLIRCGIMRTLGGLLSLEQHLGSQEKVLQCISSLSECAMTDEHELIKELCRIITDAPIDDKTISNQLVLCTKIILDLTKNSERHRDETSKYSADIFFLLKNSKIPIIQEQILGTLKHCIDSKICQEKLIGVTMLWMELSLFLKRFENFLISRHAVWIVTTLLENEAAKKVMRKEQTEEVIAATLVDCLRQYSNDSEMTDERWEIAERIVTAFKLLDQDVLMKSKKKIAAAIQNLTGNSRYNSDAAFRRNLTSYIKKSCNMDFSKIVVDWSETKLEILNRNENKSEKSLIEHWKDEWDDEKKSERSESSR